MTAIVDTNVLIYASDRDSPYHDQSREWLTSTLRGGGTVGFAWVALLGFVRIVTNPRIMQVPTTAEFALDVVDDWLRQSGAVVVSPTPNHVGVLRQLLSTAGAAGNSVNDGHLAALAIEHHASVCSFDSDFDRFGGVRRFEP